MNTFKNNLKTLIIVTIIIKILGFIYKICQARFLSFEVMTTLSMLNPILSFGLILSQLSIPIVLTSKISKNITNRSYYNRPIITKAILINIISTSIVITIMFILSIILERYFYQNINLHLPLLILLPSLFFSNLSSIIKSYLESHDEFKSSIIGNLIESIIKLLGVLIIVFIMRQSNVDIITMLISLFLTVGEISSFIFLIFKVKKMTSLKLKLEKNNNFKEELLKPGLSITIFSLIFSLYHFLEPIIYYYFTNKINISKDNTYFIYTSIHSYCLPLFQVSGFMSYIIIKIMMPKISKESNIENINKYMNTIFKKLLFFEGLIFIIIFNYSDFILNLAYKRNDMTYIMKILSIITYFTFISPIITMKFQSQMKTSNILKNAIITTITSIIILIITALIKNVSLYSIFISGAVSDILYLILNLIDYKKYFNKLFINYKDISYFILTIIFVLIMSLTNIYFNLIIIILYLIIFFFYQKDNNL